MSRLVFLVAAEPSGDALGADLMVALRAREPDLRFAGVGGAAMAAQGLASAFDIRDLSILGFAEAIPAYRRVVRRADEAAEAARAAKPDVAVLIDSWGFTIRVAKRLRAALPDLPLVKYIGPQVWATRPGRAKTLAEAVDHLICIHDFEPPFYEPFDLACTVAGHPAVGRHREGDPAGFRARAGLGPDQRFLLVLPGSRRAEIRRVGPVLAEAARSLLAQRADAVGGIIAAGSVAGEAREMAQAYGLRVFEEADKADAFAAASVALAASGTVTTEVALHGTPVVVGYKLGWVTWAIARAFLMRARFATLMNVAADREVAPEFLQTRFTAENIAAAGATLLDNPRARAAQVDAQNAALKSMGRGGRPAAEIAADAVLAQIST